MAIVLQFLDQNIFNVLKYLLMAVTISYASDVLIEILVAYNTKKQLLRDGYVKPPTHGPKMRFKRGLKVCRRPGSIYVIIVAFLFTGIELAVEFSTGAEPRHNTRRIKVLMANQAQSYRALKSGTPLFVEKIRDSLQRVENVCYNVQKNLYHKITLNISQIDLFQDLGDAAKCFGNFSDGTNATANMKQASYLASELIETKMFKKNEIRKGREFEPRTVEEGRLGNEDMRIGPLEEFSFLAVNFSKDWYVENSTTQLTGTRGFKEQKAFYTANFTVGNNQMIECLALSKNVSNSKDVFVEACILPLNDKRSLMGMFDDINGTREFQLILSVAYEGITTFRDLNALKAATWMVGKNSGMHTYRELGKLSVLSQLMINSITVEGFREMTVEVGGDLVTAPTISIWGIVLLASATGLILLGSFLLRSKYKRMPISGNLATSHGIASHWLQQEQERDDKPRLGSDVVLVMKDGDDDTPQIVVTDKSEVLK